MTATEEEKKKNIMTKILTQILNTRMDEHRFVKTLDTLSETCRVIKNIIDAQLSKEKENKAWLSQQKNKLNEILSRIVSYSRTKDAEIRRVVIDDIVSMIGEFEGLCKFKQ